MRPWVTAETLRQFWSGLPAVLIGTWVGLKPYSRLEEVSLQVVVLVLLLVSGLALRPWWWSRRTCSNTVNVAI